MNLQSFSDIITNSSSEVFIIKGQKSRNQDIMELIINLYEILGRDIDEDLDMYVASSDGVSSYGHKYKRGDIIIESVTYNSIPCAIMDFIENLDSVVDYVKYGSIERHHLG